MPPLGGPRPAVTNGKQTGNIARPLLRTDLVSVIKDLALAAGGLLARTGRIRW